MVKYNKEFKEQVLLLSDELGVKKAAGNQLSSDCRLEKSEKPQGKRREDRIGQNTDVGSQYTTEAYKLELPRRHAMHEHKRGGCYDNARMESFFAVLK